MVRVRRYRVRRRTLMVDENAIEEYKKECMVNINNEGVSIPNVVVENIGFDGNPELYKHINYHILTKAMNNIPTNYNTHQHKEKKKTATFPFSGFDNPNLHKCMNQDCLKMFMSKITQ